ncbi:hypothetical protein A7U60_g2766 [Sanghuangporus baumii]|uniref:Uncharacterized protein n=1 Tax=Sanghuangporus baumii TaxID=108892 RepID=A0A9Q5I1U8_SANBA|nr:hypothetical protein A7U60_g2766 [Sanghuangporus baumii]
MALQTLTTMATAGKTGTAVQALGTNESSGDTGGLLNSDGPQPLVPAFILSALVIVGIMMMCWWKRVSARRASASRAGVVEEGAGMNMVIGAGRGLSAGMVMLAAHGTELPTQMEVRPSVRRKKDVKLGPKPLLWDIYLERDDELDEKEMKCGWRWMMRVMYVSVQYLYLLGYHQPSRQPTRYLQTQHEHVEEDAQSLYNHNHREYHHFSLHNHNYEYPF